jgi:hypothetical protein
MTMQSRGVKFPACISNFVDVTNSRLPRNTCPKFVNLPSIVGGSYLDRESVLVHLKCLGHIVVLQRAPECFAAVGVHFAVL